jgi:hypothetical protein
MDISVCCDRNMCLTVSHAAQVRMGKTFVGFISRLDKWLWLYGPLQYQLMWTGEAATI